MKYLFLLLLVASCGVKPNQRKAVKHFQKFEKFGGVIGKDTIKVDVPIIVKGKDGQDSLIYITRIVDCPEVIFPKSNIEIRNKRKEHKQEEKTKRTEIRKDAKIEIKKDNNNRKETKFISNCWTFWDKVIFAIVMFCITHFLRYIWLFVEIFIKMPVGKK